MGIILKTIGPNEINDTQFMKIKYFFNQFNAPFKWIMILILGKIQKCILGIIFQGSCVIFFFNGISVYFPKKIT